MIDTVIESINTAENEAERIIAEARMQTRSMAVAAKQDGDALVSEAEDAARVSLASFRAQGDRDGKEQAELLVKTRAKEYEAAAQKAKERIPAAVELILQRIG